MWRKAAAASATGMKLMFSTQPRAQPVALRADQDGRHQARGMSKQFQA